MTPTTNKFACDCGMSFPTKEAMQAHGAKMHATKPAFACSCGANFGAQAEMAAHGKKAHGM